MLPDGDGPGGFKDFATGDSGSLAEIARRLGIDPRGGDTSNSHQSHSATLAAFCFTRKLDQARLRATWRVTETTHRGRPALRYPTSLGVDRIKFLDATKPKYVWFAKGGRRHFYGLAQASALGGDTLYVLNGEPAVWAATQAGVPAVCMAAGEANVPPAALVAGLSAAMAAVSFARVRVIYDAGEAHDTPGRGSRAVAAALRAGGIDATAYALPDDLRAGGDVDDLHRHVGDEGLAAALAGLHALPSDDAKTETQSASRAITVSLADVTAEQLRWVWPGRVPAGKLTLLVGDPGLGKSYLTLDLASRLSRGAPLPGGSGRSAVVSTLLLAIEDDIADTVRPRLDALGADVSRIHALTAIKHNDSERPLRLDSDMSSLEEAVSRTGTGLVVVDPLNAYLAGVDGHKDIELRGVLTPLAALAARTGAAVIAVTHTNKRADSSALHRVAGSLAYVAAARSVLAVGADPDAPGRRALVQIKSNLSAPAPALAFRVDAGVLQWDDSPIAATAETIFDTAPTARARGQDESSALDEAQMFLRKVLAGGRQLTATIFAEAKELRLSEATLRRAKAVLKIEASREKTGPDGRWWWRLPDDANRCSTDAHAETMSIYSHDEHLYDDDVEMEAF